jgi:hypothetical protein
MAENWTRNVGPSQEGRVWPVGDANRLQQETSYQTFFRLYSSRWEESDRLSFRFVQRDSPVNDSVEAKIIELHFRRYKQDEITAMLHTSKTRGSRSIRHFHETRIVPDALRLRHQNRVMSTLMSHIETRLGRSQRTRSLHVISARSWSSEEDRIILKGVRAEQIGQLTQILRERNLPSIEQRVKILAFRCQQ